MSGGVGSEKEERGEGGESGCRAHVRGGGGDSGGSEVPTLAVGTRSRARVRESMRDYHSLPEGYMLRPEGRGVIIK